MDDCTSASWREHGGMVCGRSGSHARISQRCLSCGPLYATSSFTQKVLSMQLPFVCSLHKLLFDNQLYIGEAGHRALHTLQADVPVVCIASLRTTTC